MNQTKIYLERKQELEESIRKTEAKLASMPKETIVCYKHKIGEKKYPQFYKQMQVNGKPERQYLSRKNMSEARILAQKLYLSQQLDDMKNELKCINYYINNRTDTDPSRHLAIGSPYRKLLVSDNPLLQDWEHLPYNKSTDYPDNLNVPAPKGEMMRSKSEAMIAQVLHSHGIPYRYEEIHEIHGTNFATDFTIMHPKTGAIILWEHFGRCDDPRYQHTVDYKMFRYLRDGYLPGVNFIVTYEDSKHPLSYIQVEDIVKKFFL